VTRSPAALHRSDGLLRGSIGRRLLVLCAGDESEEPGGIAKDVVGKGSGSPGGVGDDGF